MAVKHNKNQFVPWTSSITGMVQKSYGRRLYLAIRVPQFFFTSFLLAISEAFFRKTGMWPKMSHILTKQNGGEKSIEHYRLKDLF